MLQNQRIVVTGSTAGIGKAIAEAMLRAGARVAVNSKERTPDKDMMESLQALGECRYVAADMSTIDGARLVVRLAYDALGGLDCLVNNAGTCVEAPFTDFSEIDYMRTMDLNVRGYFFASQQFARLVGMRNFDANIICIASTNALQAECNHVAYDTSKGAILMMIRSMAIALAKQGIRSNAIGPGLIKTQLTDYGLRSNPEKSRFICKQIPVGRIGEPHDVAGAAVFLASDMARYITGQILYVDGGIIAQQMVYE